jgi:hypothetical protein
MASLIYQHSGESEKISPIAMQASINEDIEQRRRQLDSKGEARRIIIAKEVSHMIDEQGSLVHLHPAPYVAKETILTSTIESTKTILNSAAESAYDAGAAVANAAIGATKQAGDAVAQASATAAHKGAAVVTTATKDAAATAVRAEHAVEGAFAKAAIFMSHVGHDAASALSSAAKSFSHAAGEAAHKAADFTEKAIDTTANVAGAVGHKTLELAEGAAHKAHEVADNISHFTALMSVLAAEEKERARRLVEDESVAIINAMRLSEQIRALGPAFYRQETPNLLYGTTLLEEAERRWRLSSPYTALAATNAHNVGKLVSTNVHTFQHFVPQHQIILGHIHNLEEKERTRRLNDSNEVYAILNALATRDIIRGLGWEFYRQEGVFDKYHAAYATTLLEENERKYRIRTHQMLHSEDSAHLLMDVVSNNIQKFNWNTRQAAHFVNDFASKLGNVTLNAASAFGEKTKEFASSTVQKMQSVAGDLNNFASLMYVLALEERERARRLNDFDEIYAIQNAWKQSALIRELEGFWREGRTSRAPRFQTAYLEEIERRWRLANDDRDSKKRARAIAAIVSANRSKFERAHEYAAELQRKREVASHSRLNPNARPFVPTATGAKFDPFTIKKAQEAPAAPRNLASGAQL